MFDIIDLMIDDEYGMAYEADYSDYSGYQSSSIDIAMENFASVGILTDDEYFLYASEALLDSIDTELTSIGAELYIATESDKKEDKKEKVGFFQRIKNGIAKVLDGLEKFCKKWSDKFRSKNNSKKAEAWAKRAQWCAKQAAKLRGEKTEEGVKEIQKETEQKKEEIQEAAAADQSALVGDTVPKPGNTSRLGDGGRAPVNANAKYVQPEQKSGQIGNTVGGGTLGSDNKVRGSVWLVNQDEKPKKKKSGQVVSVMGGRLGSGWTSNNSGPVSKEMRLKEIDDQINGLKIQLTQRGISWAEYRRALAPLKKKRNEIVHESLIEFDYIDPNYDYAAEGYTLSYEVCDYDNGYAVAVEGLFSKPKTAEALLTKMQKKVGRLKTIGACDDMLRALDVESKKFNAAISGIARAQREFQKTNDKKALKQAAGPILKDLNKSCKILKLKSISSDPKNINQEEIKKLRDFISGSKQLINARKQILKKGATESMSYYDYDSESALEAFMVEDFDFDPVAYYEAGMAALDAMEADIYSIEESLEIATEGIKSAIGGAVAKIFEGLSHICFKQCEFWNKRKNEKRAATWNRRAIIFQNKADRCKGDLTKEEYKALNEDAKRAEKETKAQLERDKKLIESRKEGNALYPSEAGRQNGTNVHTNAELKMANSSFMDPDFITSESLIEDFDDADEAIAIATEGIISPDHKRANRIKFGEKKRQIKSIVKKARQAKKAKDYKTAISLYQEAKKGFAGLLAEAKKLPNYTDYRGQGYQSGAKNSLINWCISKMGECDNAIEAIRNGIMKSDRKAAKRAAKESYLNDANYYASVAESLGYDDDDDDFYDDDYDDDYEIENTLESLMW